MPDTNTTPLDESPVHLQRWYRAWLAINGVIAPAHCISFILAGGSIQGDGIQIRHGCDNPPCVNPAHLSTGTNRDNTIDSVRRGRHKSVKLTDASVAEIRLALRNGERPIHLARHYGVAKVTIKHIASGRTWRWVTLPGEPVRLLKSGGAK